MRSIKRFCSNASIVKPFEDIPGPKGFLGLGNLFNYFKVIGKYSFDALDKNGEKKFKEFGPIVLERMLPGVNIVWICDPNDIALVLKEEPGNYPRRLSHLATEKYRRERPEVYRTAGLLPTNGEEWWKIRSELQKGLSKPQNVREFLPHADLVVKEFLNLLPVLFDEQQGIKNLLDPISRLNFEIVCLMAFDDRINAFDEEGRKHDSRASKLMRASETVSRLTLPTDQGFQLWRWFENSDYRQLKEASKYLEDTCVELVAKKHKSGGSGNSLLDQYLRNPKLDVKDLHAMTVDLILAGIHTSAFTTSFALYHISNDQRVQDLMYEEALKLLPCVDDSLTGSAMNSEIPYTKAVLKESLRLNPISIGVGRILNSDLVLSGYRVPKNTQVVTQNQVSCRLEQYFPDPLKFQPERWITAEGQRKTNVHPYLVLPFGHGMRSCIARRFAEQNILIFLLRLMRTYRIEWTGCRKPLGVVTKLINEPDSNISIKFHKR